MEAQSIPEKSPPQFLTSDYVKSLSPLTPEVIAKQATINVGTIGHVAHGKSTIVRALSGVQTVRFKDEKERNITIRLGYANAKLYKCTNTDCPAPQCYASYGSAQKDDQTKCQRPECGYPMELLRHVSFVDCPGHDILMATMLNGAAVMDAALLLIAGNESCPQPQTSEHLAAVEIMRLKHIITLQNKVELVKREQAVAQFDQIKEFVRGTAAEKSPVIPVSAVLKHNIDVIVEYLCTQVPVPVRDFLSSPQMIIIRSFDVNKPGQDETELKGGVAGGSLLKGVLKIGDEIEVRPGVVNRVPIPGGAPDEVKLSIRPFKSRITSLFAEDNALEFAVPGGLIGVGTELDPTFTRADKLVGRVLSHPGQGAPEVFEQMNITYYIFRRLLGVKATSSRQHQGPASGTSGGGGGGSAKHDNVQPIAKGEVLMINIGSTSVVGWVVKLTSDSARFKLTNPVCGKPGDKVALSRRIDKHWRLIGWGQVTKTKLVDIQEGF